MSIQKLDSLHYPICDRCGEALEGEFDFYDAVQAKKDAGWRSRKDGQGNWEDVCPGCQEQEGLR